ncbi:TIGR00730 family Rossman fold protein [Lichenibacterium ramalinae]|uniref:Cytokinin riboside 5'-monophosphate phosphoribohydrolase n=1 Tax=Lichenibacterium ramalinae TaxID=2316527 RepID=A0A4Q2RB56_9HYPH|nr:TIGR00730 family Rossman fold protein [Lichenibacterium ramalinae]RYB03476.1 TIGR00730 family Rossman fold protein [Lichenibacterium ramalinae]
MAAATASPSLRRLCVFCGSNPGRDPRFLAGARDLGAHLASEGIGLVYGGASVGLMGAVADAALEAGGEVIGVIPQALADKEVAHRGLTELRVVGSMHERKAMMADLSDGFVALPGGAGTFEELFEVWTWAQLGYHAKPCGLLDIAGFYGQLTAFLDGATAQGFMKAEHRDMLVVAEAPGDILTRFRAYVPPRVGKWITADES